MWGLVGDFYSSSEIANFLTLCGTMDHAVVVEGHYFVAKDHCGAILGSGRGRARDRGQANNPQCVRRSDRHTPWNRLGNHVAGGA